MLLSFKTWSKFFRSHSRSQARRGSRLSNIVGRMESLERRDLLSALPSDGPVDERLDGNESASQARAYVANLRSDFVSSIDITTNSVVSQIPVGAGQFAIDVSPDGTRAYAALVDCSDLNCDPWGRVHDVAVIDTVAGRVLTTIHDVGLHLVDVTVSPRGDIVLLTDHLNNVVRVLSTFDNSIVTSIPVGSAPDQLAISPDGRLAYVSNVLSATVSVIDTTMLTVVATIGGVGAGANVVLGRLPTVWVWLSYGVLTHRAPPGAEWLKRGLLRPK